MKKISLIIPIYNTVELLPKCLDSAINQTYKNIEFLCIDDGSTDGSEKILDQYAKKDNRLKVVHKINGGESSARNIGLQMATGDYIGFLDCDDWIEEDMYETLINIQEEFKVDMVASGYFEEFNGKSIEMRNRTIIKDGVFERNKLFTYIYKRDYYKAFSANLWCKLFDKNIFSGKDGKIVFDEEQRLGGDILLFAHIAANCKKSYYVNQSFYHYNIRDNSTWHAKNLPVRVQIFNAYLKLLEFVEQNNIEPETHIWIKRFFAYHAKLVAEIAYEQKNRLILLESQAYMNKYKHEYIITNKEYPDRVEEFERIISLQL